MAYSAWHFDCGCAHAPTRRGCVFFSSRRRHTRCGRDWSSDVCSSDLPDPADGGEGPDPAGPGEVLVGLAELLGATVVEETRTYRHRRTFPLDPETAQGVGRALNPQAVEGQIEGGIAQGLGLALMEEIQLDGGKVRNPSFTDYL